MRYLILVLLFLFGCSSQPMVCKDESCEETDMQPTPVSVIPAKNSWGQSAQFAPGLAQQQMVLQAEFKDSTNQFFEAGNYTVQFSINDPNDATTIGVNDFVQAKAIITWSVNGNPIVREIDCGDGVAVTGVAEAVNVMVIDASNIATPANARPYTVTVAVAKGTRAPVQQPPTFSTPVFTVAPGNNTSLAVPVGIGAISVFTAVAPTTLGGSIGAYQVIVDHIQNGQVLKSYDPRQSDWVPLTPGTTAIRVRADAALTTNVRTQITFGIDG